MYRNCIFCSAPFPLNDAIELFPVGRQVAFDGAKGRLWSVCAVCSRWNLAPIEERWEAVEAAERLFRETRLRVQSENVGLARLPDGTRLVRVGSALTGELAAWRYGTQLLRRRRRYFVAGGLGMVGTVALYGGLSALGLGVGSFMIGSSILDSRRKQRVVGRATDGSGRDITIRRWHIPGMQLELGDDGSPTVVVRDAHYRKPSAWTGEVSRTSSDVAVVRGADARALLSRTMVHVNREGATRSRLNEANHILMAAGSAEEVVRVAASRGSALGKRAGRDPRLLTGTRALALEMALHEESERRALEGELAALEAAWREAEEIAAIADSLPGVAAVARALDRLFGA